MKKHKLPGTVIALGLSNLARPLLVLVSSWGTLLLLRSLDRAGKGLSNASRDALLAVAALISLYADERERGTAFGWYHLAVGLSAISAGVLFGTIWHCWNAGAAFLYAGALASLCVLLLRFWSFNDPA